MSAHILVVDDERAVRRALSLHLTKAGYAVLTASNVQEALDILSEKSINLVISDIRMPGQTGLSLLETVRRLQPNTVIIIMTGQGSIPDAVNAIRNGAAEFLLKPIDRNALLTYVQRSLESQNLKTELSQLRRVVHSRYSLDNMIAQSRSMQHVVELVKTVAETNATVLLCGPTGTGKELLARAIHYRSNRSNQPFVAVNCAALPESLLEAELFGYEKGAFTGAERKHKGCFEQSSHGTILLDEIGEIPISTQIKLLRVLQEGTFQRLGGEHLVQPNLRIVAATNQDLPKLIEEGKFRRDLYYRLNVFQIQVPALNERISDIPLLVNHFIEKYSAAHKKPPIKVTPQAITELMEYHWPGNIRELENLIERNIIISQGSSISTFGLTTTTSQSNNQDISTRLSELPLPEYLHAVEKRQILKALESSNGVQAQAAKKLGITRSNLHYRLKKLDIKTKD